ncbi:MAG: hypothetical protein BJBARM5_0573 [Candidatus Parvarchaeum acidophilus ARMAN-5]|jgi:hypothetical protein|uniref:Uncharacterized protein n=1 Tax=Candidatus Parvarchaeum acidophilus ARMAN-5 TaxID=662762 RepID=D6GVR0_PARA5|nr:MAG: hypothetical protein BJBARM5_0573 [Candidatus Parvarchaeum acidophilus ARMAN-5]
MEKDHSDNNQLFKLLPQMLFGMLGGRNKNLSLSLDNFEIKIPNIKESIKLSGKITFVFSKEKGDKK